MGGVTKFYGLVLVFCEEEGTWVYKTKLMSLFDVKFCNYGNMKPTKDAKELFKKVS